MWWTAIVAAVAKIIDIIPVQGREERWRNELDNIKKEKRKLLKNKADPKKAKRLVVINERIDYLTQLLKNVR